MRFAAAVTTVVLALVLVTGSVWLLAAQVAVFALAAFAGLRFAPYSAAFRLLVAPRIGPTHRTRGRRTGPVLPGRRLRLRRWSGLVGYATGVTALGIAATALALAAAFLNAAFGFCLGCELYGLIARLRTTSTKGVSA